MKSTNDLISIVVPIYNIDQYVGYCIESLIRQTYKALEIILVDDGSTDRGAEICDLYASKDPRIRVIHKPNGGLVSARKAGVEVATGSYIGYVDGDDWVEPDFYEALHRAAVRAEADVVCAGFSRDLFSQRVRCANNVLDGIYEGDTLERLYNEMLSYGDTFNVGITTYVWNKLFRADIAKAAQMSVDERITIGEDAAVTYPALLMAKRVYVCDNSAYHYRQREGSMLKLHAPFEQERKRLSWLYQYLRGAFQADPRWERLLPQLTNYVLSYCIIRSGGIVNGESLFGKDIRGKRVAIIQAGTFGQVMYERLKDFCTVVGWYDADYWEYRRCCMNVDPLEKIKETEMDYVLIAKIDAESIMKVREDLLALGVNVARILSVDTNTLDKKYFSMQFFKEAY